LSEPDPGLYHGAFLTNYGLATCAVTLATELPAIVASLNGIRFQSECQRIADRSQVVATFLRKHAEDAAQLRRRIESARAQADSNPGS